MITEDSLKQLIKTFQAPPIQVFIVYSFIMGYMITFIRSVHKKFGTRVFINTLLGKYQEPTEEERVFMFVDLRHSTRLAEELGHFTYSNFLKDYYHLLSNCCEENRGEIYQIAGDGVYLTWPVRKCIHKPRPLLCFYDLKLCFERTRKNFEREYGVYPTFKAAAHCGKVIVTEVGNFGSEIAFHGDAMNTTARLQDLCSPMGKEFIISEELLKKLPQAEMYHPQAQGIFELKGKKNGISIYTLDFSLDNHQ
jgi:adenylate cyclase